MATCDGKYHQRHGRGPLTVCDCGVKGRSALGPSGEAALPLIAAGGPVNWARLGVRTQSGRQLAADDARREAAARMRLYGLARKFQTKALRAGG